MKSTLALLSITTLATLASAGPSGKYALIQSYASTACTSTGNGHSLVHLDECTTMNMSGTIISLAYTQRAANTVAISSWMGSQCRGVAPSTSEVEAAPTCADALWFNKTASAVSPYDIKDSDILWDL
jgi:hypothetical protein